MYYYKYAFCYLIIINIVAVIITVYDKVCAIQKFSRISEKFLLFVSALGGSVAMMSTMLIIRHKTKHHKFMYGIPVIIIIQLSLLAVLSEYI